MPKSMIKRWILLVPLALLLSAAVACGSDGTEDGSYTDVSPQELHSLLAEDDLTLVNVYAGDMGEIEGTDLFIPYNEMAKRADELPEDQDEMIVVYCRSGRSSAAAAQTLANLGYTDVRNLDGGMEAWQDAGYSLGDAGP